MEDNNKIAFRIAELVEYKTGGSRIVFADRIGWSKQRLSNILAGKGIGLGTLQAILTSYPDVNARWLLLGEGNMLELGTIKLGSRYEAIKSLERYLPVMTDGEVALLAAGKAHFTENDLIRWKAMVDTRQKAIDEHFAAAYAKQGMIYKKDNM